MAMLKYPEATPCPTEARHLPHDCFRDDVTEDLNYTTEFKAALRHAGPRRRTSVAPRSQNAAPANHSYAARNLVSQQMEQPPSRLTDSKPSAVRLASGRRRVSQILAGHFDEDPAKIYAQLDAVAGQDAVHLSKRPRRRTIYIPPDDTTVSTIHPGLQADHTVLRGYFSQPNDQRHMNLPNDDGEKVNKCAPQRASLAAAPKRVPLKATLQPLQEMDDKQDRPAAGSGKENVPPGVVINPDSKVWREHSSRARRVSIFQPKTGCQSDPANSNTYQRQQTGTQQNPMSDAKDTRECLQPSPSIQSAKTVSNRDFRASMMKKRNSLYYGTDWKVSPKLDLDQGQQAPPTRLITAAIPQDGMSAKVKYTVLKENIERPEMFEDAWLSHQESAIHQLLNRLFETAHAKARSLQFHRQDFRGHLLHLYQSSNCSIIFKRLHASLLYGALKPPKGSIADTLRLQTDVGLRQRFLAIWLGSYDLEALMSAAEVVVGRNISLCSNPPKSNSPRNQHDLTKENIRSVELFMESCLLRNEDTYEDVDPSNPAWHWRRTMLRCLMMVLLLDKAKVNGMLHRNLFQPSSRIKSSREVLAELLSLISPFAGDAMRSLAHLHYQVHHIQYPLSEYEYGIENLATGLRDGVQLTHLVELLLYPPEYLMGAHEDVTVSMPGGEVLTSSREAENRWPLSQHLKIPCVTSTQKAYNVQVALSALSGVCGVEKMIEGVKAEDIVQGHRERTVKLLWGLVGKWGLEMIVDFDNVRGEIRRLNRKVPCSQGSESETEDDPEGVGMEKHTYLLKQWAQSIAHPQGLQVLNLTTSFSNGKVFAAIVDEYEKYLPRLHTPERSHVARLETKLKEIGCSDAFGTFGSDLFDEPTC